MLPTLTAGTVSALPNLVTLFWSDGRSDAVVPERLLQPTTRNRSSSRSASTLVRTLLAEASQSEKLKHFQSLGKVLTDLAAAWAASKVQATPVDPARFLDLLEGLDGSTSTLLVDHVIVPAVKLGIVPHTLVHEVVIRLCSTSSASRWPSAQYGAVQSLLTATLASSTLSLLERKLVLEPLAGMMTTCLDVCGRSTDPSDFQFAVDVLRLLSHCSAAVNDVDLVASNVSLDYLWSYLCFVQSLAPRLPKLFPDASSSVLGLVRVLVESPHAAALVPLLRLYAAGSPGDAFTLQLLGVGLMSRTAITALASVTDGSAFVREASAGLFALIRHRVDEDAKRESDDDEFAGASPSVLPDRGLCEVLYTLCIGATAAMAELLASRDNEHVLRWVWSMCLSHEPQQPFFKTAVRVLSLLTPDELLYSVRYLQFLCDGPQSERVLASSLPGEDLVRFIVVLERVAAHARSLGLSPPLPWPASGCGVLRRVLGLWKLSANTDAVKSYLRVVLNACSSHSSGDIFRQLLPDLAPEVVDLLFAPPRVALFAPDLLGHLMPLSEADIATLRERYGANGSSGLGITDAAGAAAETASGSAADTVLFSGEASAGGQQAGRSLVHISQFNSIIPLLESLTKADGSRSDMQLVRRVVSSTPKLVRAASMGDGMRAAGGAGRDDGEDDAGASVPIDSASTSMVLTPTTQENLSQVLEVAANPLPLLLEGGTGVGKSATVMEAARRRNKTCLRLNMSSRVTIDDLFGKVSMESRNSFVFVKRQFTQAFEEGHWLLLDEVNLAPDAVLQAIEMALDTGILQLTDSSSAQNFDRVIRRHSDFRKYHTAAWCVRV